MASKTYTVQKGDTLSKIAAQNGVKISDISGYKSGDPNKIGIGETLTIGASPASSYVSEVKDQLGGSGSGSTGSGSSSSSVYDSTKLSSDLDTYKSSLDKAKSNLEKAQTDAWDEAYKDSGLDEKKAQIATIDSDIAAARQVRDDAIAKVRANPGLSAAQMTGDIKKLADYQNGIINNKIQERNSVASEYNTGLTEVQRKADAKSAAAKTEYDYYAGLYSDTGSKLKDYQASLADQLKESTQADQFDRQLAQAMEIAQLNASKKGSSGSNLQLKSDPNTGDPLYWFDPDTGAITYINGNNGGGNDGFDSLGSDKGTDTSAPASTSTSQPWYSRLWNAITGK